MAIVEEISTTFSKTCTQSGSNLAVGDALRLIFRPRDTGDNGTVTSLIFLAEDKGSRLRLPIGADFSGTLATNVFSRVLSEGVVSYGAKFEGASVSPSNFTVATRELVVSGWVESVFASCKFRFRAHLQKQ